MEESITELAFSLNTAWVLICAFLVFFMQAGFGMLEAGFTRAKSAVSVLMKNLMDLSFGVIGFFFIGYALMFGEGNAFIGQHGFELLNLPPETAGIATGAFFLFQAAFAATAATIVAGAVAERTKFLTYIVLSFLITAFIYPVVGHWVWGGGWLAAKGFVDFAGSTVVHSVGGWVALIGAILVGPRLGRFNLKKKKDFTGHSIPLATLGVFILWFGWYGFNSGSQLAIASSADTAAVSLIAMNTTLAAAVGGIVAMVLVWILTSKPQAGPTLNGVLGGLVAITAGCASVSPIGAMLIGAAGGVTVFFATVLLEKLQIDDAVGAFPVHGACGMLGTLAVGFFATDGGLFYGGGMKQLGIQALGVVAVAAWVFVTAIPVLLILKKIFGLRVSRVSEETGLDAHKHGVSAYPDFNLEGVK
ncbi:ammonium transporter [Candidatus Gracilibacteria bacterium]|nr:ammonium transporter [Candidatus Gracilibacteria bacterium]MCF7856372.1 ammonium transporter [Candidatus Gracilibacteria bacterium]MCF7896832.1 ammonium transporter [Candidatus Gracilibacteria bacterium]